MSSFSPWVYMTRLRCSFTCADLISAWRRRYFLWQSLPYRLRKTQLSGVSWTLKTFRNEVCVLGWHWWQCVLLKLPDLWKKLRGWIRKIELRTFVAHSRRKANTLWMWSSSSYSHFYVWSMYDDIRLHVAYAFLSSGSVLLLFSS